MCTHVSMVGSSMVLLIKWFCVCMCVCARALECVLKDFGVSQ